MINKSKLGAIALIAAIGLVSPAFAANYGPQYYAPSQTGGGSAGYNHNLSDYYRLKQHSHTHHAAQPSATKTDQTK
jgi:hypothetical protein